MKGFYRRMWEFASKCFSRISAIHDALAFIDAETFFLPFRQDASVWKLNQKPQFVETVVGFAVESETWDVWLNQICSFHVKQPAGETAEKIKRAFASKCNNIWTSKCCLLSGCSLDESGWMYIASGFSFTQKSWASLLIPSPDHFPPFWQQRLTRKQRSVPTERQNAQPFS